MDNDKRRRPGRTIGLLTVGFLAGGVAIAATYPAEADASDLTDQVAAVTAERDDLTAQLADVKANLAAAKAKAHKVKVARDGARTERDNLAAQVDTLTATLDGQYDINADYAEQIAKLKATKPETVTIAPSFWEDGSWQAGDQKGCAPTALCDDAYQDSLIKDVPSHLATWEGFRVGEVILCPKGWTVADDTTPEGQQWAACQ